MGCSDYLSACTLRLSLYTTPLKGVDVPDGHV
jgi:hypothetical protein